MSVYNASKAASRSFPVAAKSLDSFDFAIIPKLNKKLVLDLARCEWIERRENVIALPEQGEKTPTPSHKIADAACGKVWSGYAFPTFRARSASWPTFAPPNGRFAPPLERRS